MEGISPIETTQTPELPFTRVDALLVLGIGGNLQLKGPDRSPVIEDRKMRMNAIATKEIAARRHLPESAIIIPTGKGTELVDFHHTQLAAKQDLIREAGTGVYALRDALPDRSYAAFQQFLGQPESEEEMRTTSRVTQGDLMTDLIRRAKIKPDGGHDRLSVPQEILPEPKARNTILNVIEALNLLDEKTGGVWEGNMAILTTNSGHLERSEEIAHALGLGNVLMLAGEEILSHYGYNQEYLDTVQAMSDGEVREQEKNYRAIRELPEFLIPEITYIRNDDRLKRVVTHLESYYGPDALKKFNIQNYHELTADEIRDRVGAVGLDRTRTVLSLCSPEQVRELGVEGMDPVADIEQIRAQLAGGVKQGEILRTVLMDSYGSDAGWLETHDLTNLQGIEWWRIKNWLFGRKLPPAEWGNTGDRHQWEERNRTYADMTRKWLEQTEQPNT